VTEDRKSMPDIVPGRVVGQGRAPAQLAFPRGDERRLTSEQQAVVSGPAVPGLVVAGAGSGKTETLALRFVYLLDHAKSLFGCDLAPDEILCLTFTRKAAAEIADRVVTDLGRVFGFDGDRPAPAVSTYNAYASGLVAEHGLRVGVDPDAVVLSEASAWQLAYRLAESWEGELDFDGDLSAAAQAVSSLAASLADHNVEVGAMAEFLTSIVDRVGGLPPGPGRRSAGPREKILGPLRSRLALVPLIERYQAAKREASALDFADQIAVALQLSQVPSIRGLERSRYRAVLLDEFQDTSPGQLDLLANLFGSGHPVTAVGDPFQAIYGFRGASEAALERFLDRFGVEGPPQTLSVSWRNSSGVLEAANSITSALRMGSGIGVPRLRSRSEEKGESEPDRKDPAVTAHLYPDEEAEAAGLVARLVERRAALGALRHGDEATGAVLLRKRDLLPPIVQAFREAGVDFQVVGIGGLLDTPVVVDLVALLQAAHDPSRGDSLMRLLTSERVALGMRDLAALGEWSEEMAGPREDREVEASLVEALTDMPPDGWESRDGRALSREARSRLGDLQRVLEAIRAHTYLPLDELVRFAARVWNLDIETRVTDLAMEGEAALQALEGVARDFEQGANVATLGAFLAWLQAAYEHERGLDVPVGEPREGAVQVLTVHGAKGMEWDIVAVPGLVDGTFPSVAPSTGGGSGAKSSLIYRDGAWLSGRRGKHSLPWPLRRDRGRLPSWDWEGASSIKELEEIGEEFHEAAARHALEEERRLFYVAVTRARSDVILTSVPNPRARRPQPMSVFLADLENDGIVSPDPIALDGSDVEDSSRIRTPAVWPPSPTPSQEARRRLATEVREARAKGTDGVTLPYADDIEDLLRERSEEGRTGSVDLPAHLSSTDVVRLATDRESYALTRRRPMPRISGAAARKGDAFHAWVERYYRMPTLTDPEDVFAVDGGDGAPAEGVELAGLREAFLDGEWADRLPTAVEVDIEMPVEEFVLRCRIDAVFPPGNGLDRVTIVDWKTGRPPKGPHDRAAREVQLAIYRLAWAAWKGIPVADIDAVFVFLPAGEVVRPARSLDRDEILELVRGR